MPPETEEIEITSQFSETDGSNAPTEDAAETTEVTEAAEEEMLEAEETEVVENEPEVVDVEPQEEVIEEVTENSEPPAGEPEVVELESEDNTSLEDDKSFINDRVLKRILGLNSLADAEALVKEVDSLRAENAELRAFKLETERGKKQELMQKFAMLENEQEYKELAENLDSYSFQELESKICVLYVHTTAELDSIGAEVVESKAEEADPITTFNLDTAAETVLPGFLSALRKTNH